MCILPRSYFFDLALGNILERIFGEVFRFERLLGGFRGGAMVVRCRGYRRHIACATSFEAVGN
jgi:hypothetical protein